MESRACALCVSAVAVFAGCASLSVSRAVMNTFYPEAPTVQNESATFSAHMPQNTESDGIYGPFFQLVAEVSNLTEMQQELALEEMKLIVGDEVFVPNTLSAAKGSYPKQNDNKIRQYISTAFLRPGPLEAGQTRKGTLYFPEKAARKIADRDQFKVEYKGLVITFLKKK
jgi:hypothetical protein